MRKKRLIFAAAVCFSVAATAQDNFLPGGNHFTALRGERLVKVEFVTDNATDTLLDVSGRGIQGHILSADGAKALLISGRTPIYRHSFTADYSAADLATGRITPLSNGGKDMRDASFSPDGRLVAFVRDNDLFTADPASGIETRVTADGMRNHIINGVADWVYEEEYGFTRAYEFSPDSRRIAYLRFDESRVKEFAMMRYDGELYPEPYLFKYPKAGEENSVVELFVYDIAAGQTRRIDTGPETDQYIPRIGWTPGGDLFFYRVNRLQNLFEVLLAGPDGGVRTIYSESSPRYVERPDDETVTFLPDGDRFIVKNETRTGWMHLYLYSIKKGFLNAVTSGEWEVTGLVGAGGDRVWYLSTESSPLNRDLYSVRVDGKDKKCLAGGGGTYSAMASPGMKYYRQTFSSAGSPPMYTFHKCDGTLLGESPRNRQQLDMWEARKKEIPAAEFFSFVTGEGISLDGYIIKPADFDPSKKYPLFMTQYSGPGSQSVADRFSPDMMLARLAQAGYLVACVDGRGTGGRGEEFRKCTYGQLGRLETEDQIAAARYLGSLPYVDPSRIGIYGWSYGGFMALNCILKGADVFKLAVAVAPVTSWRYYDTIYTEIYNGLPQENPEGYDDNSPVNFANLLEGKLLLVHGTGDDNVHVQNSFEMAKALVGAGKQFDMMIYPDDNHSMWPNGSANVREKIVDYVLNNL